jgi:hypothetical protein
MDLQEGGLGHTNWIDLAYEMDGSLAVVNAVMNLRRP